MQSSDRSAVRFFAPWWIAGRFDAFEDTEGSFSAAVCHYPVMECMITWDSMAKGFVTSLILLGTNTLPQPIYFLLPGLYVVTS